MKKMRELNTADRKKRSTLIIFIVVTAVLVAAWALLVGKRTGFGRGLPRANPEQSGTPRVYDYADMLTDSQEQALEERIAAAEQSIHADIVIVLLNESIEEKYPDLLYLRDDERDAYRGIKRFTENYWVENGFGWNEAGNTGNGIIMVDNIYRESNGWVYNWVAGAGDMRFSVGDENCQQLSQAFTDRLPMGDMPHYDQTYADALLAFVDDCDTFGNKVRGILGWSLFSPSTLFAAITSSFIATIAVAVILCGIFGMMLWHLNYNGRQKRKKKKGKFLSGLGGIASFVLLFICFAVNWFIGILGFIIYIVVVAVSSVSTGDGDKKKKKEKGGAPFAQRDILHPDSYRVTDSKDTFVRHYVTSYTESDSSSGGGGGGGFSGGGGGGGGGGGFSGGGSHR